MRKMKYETKEKKRGRGEESDEDSRIKINRLNEKIK
jgi:hypothetical protein